MSGNAFHWLLSAMLGALLALIGVVYNNMNARIAATDTKLNLEIERGTRTNERINMICTRVTVVEYKIGLPYTSC